MKKYLHQSLAFLIGIAVAGLAVAIALIGGNALLLLGGRVTDAWTVQSGGPRLGARPVSNDIVLVLFDVRTGSNLGYVRSYSDDAEVYRRLVDAGVSVIYDTRIAASASQEDFDQLRPLLEVICELDCECMPLASSESPQPVSSESEVAEAGTSEGKTQNDSSGQSTLKAEDDNQAMESTQQVRVIRDIWLSSSFQSEDIGRYAAIAIPNVVSVHPHAIPSLRSRLYPLAQVTNFGMSESAPLVIARHLWNEPAANKTTVVQQLLESGVMAAWHRQVPDQIDATHEPYTDYSIGENRIAWHFMPTTTPFVPPAGFWVSYDPDISQYQRISYLDILQGEESDFAGLEGKVVIIGHTLEADPSSDTYEVPSGMGKVCSAEVLAAATQTLLDGRSMRVLPWWGQCAMLLLFSVLASCLSSWLRPLNALALTIALVFNYLALAILLYWAGWLTDFTFIPLATMMSGVMGGTLGAWNSHRSHGRLVDLFGRYVPRAVVNQLLLQSDLNALQLGGVKREVTVLFADIRGFTAFSENMPPEQVVSELNSLLRIMVECTFAFEGTLDKFIGDAILVLFNAPLSQPDHPTRAVRMALELQRRLKQHSSKLGVGIGIHSGHAVVGNIGTPERMEYTAVGSTVNLASRLCDFALSGSIVVSKAVVDAIDEQGSADGEFTRTQLAPLSVKGVSLPVQAWSVLQPSGEPVKGD